MYAPKFNQFDISQVTYKVVNEQPIHAFIMLPKDAIPGSHPVIAKFHGGAFITGASLYPDWFPQWSLDYCIQNSAMIVAADYRLMPESNGLEILDDVLDFWKWVESGELQKKIGALKEGVIANLDKMIVYGESAGATLALLSGFNRPDIVKGVIATYPMVNRELKREKLIAGSEPIPAHILQDYLKAMVPGKIVTSANPPERFQVWMSMTQQDRLEEFYGTDYRLSPLKALERTETTPYMLIMHGSDDTIVPIKGSYQFEELANKKFGPGKVDLVVQPGEHGFDVNVPLQEPWLEKALENVTKLWL